MGVQKFPKLGLSRLWGPITLCVNLQLRWHLKQSCNPCQGLSNFMSHTTCTQENQGDFWLLVVGSQIAYLTFGPSFSHNLCLKCPNGSCEPILDIYVLRDFQWYKEIFNLMSLDPWNFSLKIQKSIGTTTPKVRACLGVWGFIPSDSPTLSHTPSLHIWLTPSQALALVASPRLRLRQILQGDLKVYEF
jgi:hypothetical protein